MKLAVPAMVAWYFSERTLPPKLTDVIAALLLLGIPAMLIGLQPDLGTAILIAASGLVVLFMAGLSWRLIAVAVIIVVTAAPLMYFFVMHDYQRNRVDTFLNPKPTPGDRLEHHPVENRHRLRRRQRQGLARRHPIAARLPAGIVHRLHSRGTQ